MWRDWEDFYVMCCDRVYLWSCAELNMLMWGPIVQFVLYVCLHACQPAESYVCMCVRVEFELRATQLWWMDKTF